jgi:hypothetical protein
MKYEQVFIKSEKDLPEKGERYFCHHKKAGRIEAQEYFLEYDKDYWLGHIDWYLKPIPDQPEPVKDKIIKKMEELVKIYKEQSAYNGLFSIKQLESELKELKKETE